MSATGFSALLQRFFVDRLVRQLGASPHTVASYRDTFRLLLHFASERLGRAPSELKLDDFEAPFLVEFLVYLEKDRHVSVRTRNTRLAAIHSFFRYVAFSEPACALLCQRALAIPAKRYERAPIEFLQDNECDALIEAPDTSTWIGRRDHCLLLLAIQTGLRNNEIISLTRKNVQLGNGAHIRCLGKGRKARCTPLQPDAVRVLKLWLAESTGRDNDPVFSSSRGGFLSRDALERLVKRHVISASQNCPSLKDRKVTPHTLRHSAAMSLLRRGVDLTVIALWLGHESTETTMIYLHADMKLKERALQHASETNTIPQRFRPSDDLIAFLEKL
jgi:site-specific recombinase XerD